MVCCRVQSRDQDCIWLCRRHRKRTRRFQHCRARRLSRKEWGKNREGLSIHSCKIQWDDSPITSSSELTIWFYFFLLLQMRDLPVNALSGRAYTWRKNIETLLSTGYSEQKRLTSLQISLLWAKLKPDAKSYPILRVNQVFKKWDDGEEYPETTVLTHQVYNIADITTPTKEVGSFEERKQKKGNLISIKQEKYLQFLISKVFANDPDEKAKLYQEIKNYSTKKAFMTIQNLKAQVEA